ncbi:hypothetical protein MAR_012036 [Mya arenaria]|uniref:Uncharacterized protein n=1 Tax=Mya arenaria TaxID=6604 RepID=A0ABY7FVY8_MYAAR|nr:hypothetical protein MAR_012036 [Mya arenaria]
MTAEQPQFKYRSVIIESIMTRNCLSYRVQWSLHGYSALTRDIYFLSEMHPAIYEELVTGKLIPHKTHCPLSAMTLNQALANANVNGDGLTVGLTDNPYAIQR